VLLLVVLGLLDTLFGIGFDQCLRF